jgi:5,10-methylenetetrahydromethanopterin reductase
MTPALGLSIAGSPREPVARIVQLVRAAEERGVDAVWVLDSQLLYKDAYIVLGLLAASTSTVKLGPGVTNVVTRHQTVVANAMSTLATIAPGRINVGLGAGDSSVFPVGLQPLRVAACREAILRLRQLLGGEAVDEGGGSGGPVRLSVTPPKSPPIFLAASQPRMLQLAGEVADGVIVVGPADPDVVRMQLACVDRGRQAAGRQPADVIKDVWVTISIGPAEQTVGDVKSFAATVGRWFTTWRDLPASLEPFRAEMETVTREYDFMAHLSVHAEHARLLSDDFAHAVAVAGPPEVCLARVRAIAAAGPDRMTLSLLPGGRERRLAELLDLWAVVGS